MVTLGKMYVRYVNYNSTHDITNLFSVSSNWNVQAASLAFVTSLSRLPSCWSSKFWPFQSFAAGGLTSVRSRCSTRPWRLFSIVFPATWQCDQIGLFVRGLGDRFSRKSCPISQKSHKVNRRNLRSVVCTVLLGPPRGAESDDIYPSKQELIENSFDFCTIKVKIRHLFISIQLAC